MSVFFVIYDINIIHTNQGVLSRTYHCYPGQSTNVTAIPINYTFSPHYSQYIILQFKTYKSVGAECSPVVQRLERVQPELYDPHIPGLSDD